MSKTMDELAWIYLNAFAEEGGHDIYAISKPDERTRAGIAAVVRELMEHFVTGASTYAWDADDLHAEFMKILGDAGDEVAGVLAVESREGAMISEAPEAPATAPAPAVCVWTDVGDAYRSACGRSHFAWTSRGGVVVCPGCKAPIKFTEAK